MSGDHASVRQQLRLPLSAAVVLLLGAAFGRWPYGFYQILRLLVCASCVYRAMLFMDVSRGRMWLVIAIAILFNPLVPSASLDTIGRLSTA